MSQELYSAFPHIEKTVIDTVLRDFGSNHEKAIDFLLQQEEARSPVSPPAPAQTPTSPPKTPPAQPPTSPKSKVVIDLDDKKKRKLSNSNETSRKKRKVELGSSAHAPRKTIAVDEEESSDDTMELEQTTQKAKTKAFKFSYKDLEVSVMTYDGTPWADVLPLVISLMELPKPLSVSSPTASASSTNPISDRIPINYFCAVPDTNQVIAFTTKAPDGTRFKLLPIYSRQELLSLTNSTTAPKPMEVQIPTGPPPLPPKTKTDPLPSQSSPALSPAPQISVAQAPPAVPSVTTDNSRPSSSSSTPTTSTPSSQGQIQDDQQQKLIALLQPFGGANNLPNLPAHELQRLLAQISTIMQVSQQQHEQPQQFPQKLYPDPAVLSAPQPTAPPHTPLRESGEIPGNTKPNDNTKDEKMDTDNEPKKGKGWFWY